MLRVAALALSATGAFAVPERRLQFSDRTSCQRDDQCRLPCPMGLSGTCVLPPPTPSMIARTGSCQCTGTPTGPTIYQPPMEGPAVGKNAGPCAVELSQTVAMAGAPTPTCDEQGGYQPVQCFGSVGTCWCAAEDGTEIDGTRSMCRGPCSVTPESCLAARASGGAAGYGNGGPQIAVDPMPIGYPTRPQRAPATAGGRCAATGSFCEDANDCPQCAAGLSCNVPAGVMCAGTCFGTCSKGH